MINITGIRSARGSGELALTGERGFLPEMIKAVLERGLPAELTGMWATSAAIQLGEARRTAACATC